VTLIHLLILYINAKDWWWSSGRAFGEQPNDCRFKSCKNLSTESWLYLWAEVYNLAAPAAPMSSTDEETPVSCFVENSFIHLFIHMLAVIYSLFIFRWTQRLDCGTVYSTADLSTQTLIFLSLSRASSCAFLSSSMSSADSLVIQAVKEPLWNVRLSLHLISLSLATNCVLIN